MIVYNEIEPFAASWLRNLSDAGHIATGSVDVRSIRDLRADDVVGATQFHTFAGIGAWSYALRLAGWPDDRPVWTGSCPCQPFSVAGKGGGVDDERHLWPEWFRLIRECRPVTIFGEQVASPDGLAWLDAVHADLEGEGYTVGAAVLPAAGVGAPHARHRIFFGATLGRMADADGGQRGDRDAQRGGEHGLVTPDGRVVWSALRGSESDGVADAKQGKRGRVTTRKGCDDDRAAPRRKQGDGESESSREGCNLADPIGNERGQVRANNGGSGSRGREEGVEQRPLHRSPWDGPDWLPCRDGKARPVESGTFPLAHGTPARVGRLRAYGNAIVPQVAAAFVTAFMGATT